MKMFVSIVWFASLIIVGFVSFAIGHASKTSDTKNVLMANTSEVPTTEPSPQITSQVISSPTPALDNSACAKTGFAQKWEYLTPYVIKQNDSLQSIAKEELKDETRVDEILKINGVGQLVVGSTLYLPPSSITKSSGNLKQVYGKLVEKTTAAWHVSFSTDPKGQGVLIPAFLFESVANKDTFTIGDCIKVFFDDGFKVYTVSLE